MPTDNLILQTLNNSTLTEELRDAEIETLGRLFEVKEFKAGEALLRPGEEKLKELPDRSGQRRSGGDGDFVW